MRSHRLEKGAQAFHSVVSLGLIGSCRMFAPIIARSTRLTTPGSCVYYEQLLIGEKMNI
jgi:hypothetical protein